MSISPLGTRSLKVKIGESEYNTDISKFTLASAAASSDFVSFAAAAAGGARQYSMKFTATQDPADPSSIWSQVWSNAGQTADVVINPYGGATASVTNPLIEGTVTITEPDGDLLGGDANASTTSKFTVDLEWVFTAKPTLVTTGTY